MKLEMQIEKRKRNVCIGNCQGISKYNERNEAMNPKSEEKSK